MTDKTNSGGDQQTNTNDLQTEIESLKAKLAKTEADLNEAKADLSSAADLQDKLNRAVTDKSRALREKEEAENSFKEYKAEILKNEVSTHLTTALEEAGARSTSTALKLMDLGDVMKLVDENGKVALDKIAEAVNAVKTTDPEMFFKEGENADSSKKSPANSAATTSGQLPPVKHAADRLTQSGFDTALAAAVKTGKQSEIDAVVSQFNITA